MNKPSQILQDFLTGLLRGEQVIEVTRTLGDLDGVFKDRGAFGAMDSKMPIYRVQSYQPLPDGLEGGLFWGCTFLQPGLVGDEYFVTKGHFHAIRNRGEYYVTLTGRGALVLMSEDRQTRFESMEPGTVHYIPGNTAHRAANIGDSVLSFLACWPSDAGHDYESIAKDGFSARMRQVSGQPSLVSEL